MLKMLMFDTKKTELEFLENFDTSDFDITYFSESLNNNTKLTVNECDKTVILSVFISSEVNSKVLDKFKNLRIIATRSICYNHIDVEECRKRNIAVINVNDYGKSSVAQYVIGLIFALTRNILCASNDVKIGNCDYEKYESEIIDKLSLGVIGTGKIGSEVCSIANKLDMKIYANDIIINKDLKDFVEYVSLNELLRKSDIITLHIPYIKDFHNMISKQELELMKDGSYLINTSHYGLVDPIALYQALKGKTSNAGGKLGGCALDIILDKKETIFTRDKKPEYQELEDIVIKHELFALDNVIITPRIAYDTKESLRRILISNFHDIKDYYIGRKTNRVI